MGIKKSKGVKRFLTGLLAVVTFAAPFIPALTPFVDILIQITGGLGAVAITHAAATKSLFDYKTGSIASILSAVLAVFTFLPEWNILGAFYTWLTGVFGVAAISVKADKKK